MPLITNELEISAQYCLYFPSLANELHCVNSTLNDVTMLYTARHCQGVD